MKLAFLSALLPGVLAAASPEPLKNANHIFNAIHASMRQWGSSIHHNGMSFFLASTPAGTRLYHGNADANPIQEIGWMAFEPEHAMVFARPPRRGPKDDDNRPRQEVLGQENLEQDRANGWLHTYQTTRELRLLYIDGTSAGKSRIGTLDLQDRIVFNDTIDGGVSMEDARARKVCELAGAEWQGRLDGVIRMAAGFEIILCAPEKILETVKIMPVRKDEQNEGGNKLRAKSGDMLRAITSRFNGIGGDRVRVYYEHFVTAYTFNLDLWPKNSTVPRLKHLSSEDLTPIRHNLTALILDHEPNITASVNWQFIADMIVARYGRFLQGLAHGQRHHTKHDDANHTPRVQIKHLMAGFGDDIEESISLCSTQFLSMPTDNSPLAHKALYAISNKICSTLTPLQSETVEKVVHDTVRGLMHDLDWTIWKECRGCKGDEFCAIPIWPQGTQEDFEHPKCRKFDEGWSRENGYWGEIWR
ncbi:hypothetical protein BJX64DRAFT_298925 [Aspergillus heterothallicus]